MWWAACEIFILETLMRTTHSIRIQLLKQQQTTQNSNLYNRKPKLCFSICNLQKNNMIVNKLNYDMARKSFRCSHPRLLATHIINFTIIWLENNARPARTKEMSRHDLNEFLISILSNLETSIRKRKHLNPITCRHEIALADAIRIWCDHPTANDFTKQSKRIRGGWPRTTANYTKMLRSYMSKNDFPC